LGEALDRFDLIEDDQGQDSAYSGNGLKQGVGAEVLFFGRCDEVMFQLGEEMIIGLDHFQVHGNAFLD
jgi:hypothetical protein